MQFPSKHRKAAHCYQCMSPKPTISPFPHGGLPAWDRRSLGLAPVLLVSPTDLALQSFIKTGLWVFLSHNQLVFLVLPEKVLRVMFTALDTDKTVGAGIRESRWCFPHRSRPCLALTRALGQREERLSIGNSALLLFPDPQL